MYAHTLKLLAFGYALALLVAMILADGWLATLLTAWLTAPLWVVALASLPPFRRWFDGEAACRREERSSPSERRLEGSAAHPVGHPAHQTVGQAAGQVPGEIARWDADLEREVRETAAAVRRGAPAAPMPATPRNVPRAS